MKHIIPISCLLFTSLSMSVVAQEPAPTLAGFFRQRLEASADTPPPSYEVLLRVIDPIASSDPKEIAAALPFVSSALKSSKENLAVEATFALYEISQRADGGTLLRSRIREIAELLDRPDERVGGGAVQALRFLTPADGDVTVPAMIGYLNGPAKPSLVKSEIVSALLHFRHDDPVAVKAMQTFFAAPAEPAVRIATLQALTANRVTIPGMDGFAIQSLGDPNKFIKLAAIHTVHALGPEVWNRAQPIVTNLAIDPSSDPEVRTAAQQVLKAGVVAGPQ